MPVRRIVSLVPSLTETLILWGKKSLLCGITDYCVLPKEAVRDIPRIGGTKDPDIEKIAALAPDLVLANAEENRKEDIEKLEARGIACWTTFPKTVVGVKTMVERLLPVLGLDDHARPFLMDLDRELGEGRSLTNPIFGDPKIGRRAAYLIWRDPWMTINRDTYIHDVLIQLGFLNVFADRPERYLTIGLGEVAERRPDWVILPSEPFPFAPRHAREIAEATGIGVDRMLLAPGEDYCWFGARTAQVFETHRRLLGAALGKSS